MFGSVLVDRSRLLPEQEQRYKAVYCGLCRCIGKKYGPAARMTLSYDMTFLILLLDSLYEPDRVCAKKRCAMHPFKPRPYCFSKYTEYAAATNVALAYHKALDDWQDDRDLFAWFMTKLLLPGMKKIQKAYPEKCQHMANALRDLTKLEKENMLDPDAAAACFGRLTGELFVADETDHWASCLRNMGDALGRFIYLADALMDLSDDMKKNRYNPLKETVKPGHEDAFLPALEVTIGDCAEYLEHLPLEQDLDLLRNIIYSGVWGPYYARKAKKKGRDTLVR